LKTLLIIIAIVFLTSVVSSSSVAVSGSFSSSVVGTSGTFTDVRDSKVYRWVKIGTQVWMSENLNYAATDSKCGKGNTLSDANTSTCDTYGRQYNWEAVMAACPSGWHLPNKAEWDALASYIESDNGCSYCDAMHLKSAIGWNNGGNGLDSYGFSALPNSDGNYNAWWSATEPHDSSAYGVFMHHPYATAFWFSFAKSALLSVRCVKD
jgi:uncharacterized protein (TIGR02145 family)